ncbi:hypothetical protein DH2020_002020 [Rehmannia glutinosa]|uniref:Plant heme peroxidase family profile domain-containing protein n=1 Tax=Rehmannia glutinosa TaxID=99300 RepID=A0ABR0XT90_REHGL
MGSTTLVSNSKRIVGRFKVEPSLKLLERFVIKSKELEQVGQSSKRKPPVKKPSRDEKPPSDQGVSIESQRIKSPVCDQDLYPGLLPLCILLIDQYLVDSSGSWRREDLEVLFKMMGVRIFFVPFDKDIDMGSTAEARQRRKRSFNQSKVKGTLATALKGNPDLIPSVLTLALNDAITYDKATKSGGPNGSIRFSSEISRPENKNLAAALSLLEEAKKEIDSYSKGGPISYSDLIQYAAQSAVKSTFLSSAIRKCGGNQEKGTLLYTAYGSSGQWGLFDKQFGRSDAEQPDPEGRVPQWEKSSVVEMKNKFSAIGFGPRQLAVMSAFFGPDQSATEALLASDPDVLPWVQKYQRSRETVSQTDYEVDLITTLTKLSSLGQQINYEAYTYPVKKVDLSKLKL